MSTPTIVVSEAGLQGILDECDAIRERLAAAEKRAEVAEAKLAIAVAFMRDVARSSNAGWARAASEILAAIAEVKP